MTLVQIAGTSPMLPQPTHDTHVFETDFGAFVFMVEGSRVYEIDDPTIEQLKLDDGPKALRALGLHSHRNMQDSAPLRMPVRSLSLAVAQKCNLGCSYCYAQEGSFGREPRNMEREVALGAVRLLFQEAQPGEGVNLAFLGGEPLLNRSLIRECAELGQQLSQETGVRISFSITTNGTLLTVDDGELFERYGFAVTVSLDGVGKTHDRLRPFRGGQGSYAKIIANVQPLLKMQRRMQVSARVSVTPSNLRLRETLDELLRLGFHSVGFSPTMHAPSGRGEMHKDELQEMLRQMIECGEEFERRTIRGERYALATPNG